MDGWLDGVQQARSKSNDTDEVRSRVLVNGVEGICPFNGFNFPCEERGSSGLILEQNIKLKR